MEIAGLKTSSLRNEEHYEFNTEAEGLIQSATPAAFGIEKEFALYSSLLKSEETILKTTRASIFTTDLGDTNIHREEILHGINLIVRGCCLHPNDNIRQAAKRIKLLMGDFGDVANMPFDQETATIKLMYDKLTGSHTNDLILLHIDDWMGYLKTTNDAFAALKEERYLESSAKELPALKDIRMAIDEQYHAITKRINSLIVVNGPEAYSSFVTDLNQRIGNFNLLITLRKGRHSKGNEPPAAPKA